MRLTVLLASGLFLLAPAAPQAQPAAREPVGPDCPERPQRRILGIPVGPRCPPPPRPAPQATPAEPSSQPAVRENRRFFVYMPFDHVRLTPDGVAAVDEAAAYAKAGRAARIRLTGHTDTSGRAEYNLGQSERYARLVAVALTDRGVSPAILQLDWKGEAELAVPTPDNFREPGNRRVTIDVEF